MTKTDYLSIMRIVYIGIIASAFSTFLGKDSLDIISALLTLFFILFVGCESVTRTIACNAILEENNTQSITRFLFSISSAVLEFISVIAVTHWFIGYINNNLDPEHKKNLLILQSYRDSYA